jgi:hypothetical protein
MNLMNLIKVMNFSGAGEPINFNFVGFTRRVERLLADAAGADF